jgi:tRNA threonylcarbamoyladenosine modification (KEOPS) complex  Pcc1 subunit
MKDTENLHLKVQELCDCYSTTDPLKEMSAVKNDEDAGDAALKWLALAALHGVNNTAKKISIKQSLDGTVSVTAEYRDTQIPSPGADVAEKIFEAVREITHIEEKKGKCRLALGIRDSSLDLEIKIKDKDDYKKVSIKFP